MSNQEQEKVTLLFPTFNRLEFTKVALEALINNTNPDLVDRLLIVDTGSEDGTVEYVTKRISAPMPFPSSFISIPEKHVVNTMLTAYEASTTPLIAKVDSDTVVPKGWLDACVSVMKRNPEFWVLGIEPFTDIKDCPPEERGGKDAEFIGGIGLFRRDAWRDLHPGTPPFFGWTEHQSRSKWKKAWLKPAMNVFLLDHLPFEPWLSLAKAYAKKKWQRPWAPYTEEISSRWEWRFPDWNKK